MLWRAAFLIPVSLATGNGSLEFCLSQGYTDEMLAIPFRLSIIPAVLMLAGCAATVPGQVNDPYEATNRRVHAFNKGLDEHLVRPLTSSSNEDEGQKKGENGLLTVVGNVSGNLTLPGKAVNSLLQGRPGKAARNTGRFLINSTLGLGGLNDPAGQEFGLDEVDTDFGETLYVWGAPEGAYVELPLLGPSTQRDAFGKVVDLFIDPLGAVIEDNAVLKIAGIKLASKIGDRARFGDTVDSILYDSADSYAQTRLLYLDHRRYELGMEGGEIDPYDDPYAE